MSKSYEAILNGLSMSICNFTKNSTTQYDVKLKVIFSHKIICNHACRAMGITYVQYTNLNTHYMSLANIERTNASKSPNLYD